MDMCFCPAFVRCLLLSVVSLQLFGCRSNYIVSKGVEKKMKELFSKMDLLFLDFDNDVSDINVLNRIHFIINYCKDSCEELCR